MLFTRLPPAVDNMGDGNDERAGHRATMERSIGPAPARRSSKRRDYSHFIANPKAATMKPMPIARFHWPRSEYQGIVMSVELIV